MLFSFIVGEVRVKGRVRVMMSIGTLNIFCLKTKEFQITMKNELVRIPTETGELTVQMSLWICESMGRLGLGLQPVSQ